MLIIAAKAEPVSRYELGGAGQNPVTEFMSKAFNTCSARQRWPALRSLHQEFTVHKRLID